MKIDETEKMLNERNIIVEDIKSLTFNYDQSKEPANTDFVRSVNSPMNQLVVLNKS